MRGTAATLVGFFAAACGQHTDQPRSAAKVPSPVAVESRKYQAACVAVLSCIPGSELTVSECATSRTQLGLLIGGGALTDRETECIARALGDCDAISHCVGASPHAAACKRPFAGSCEGRVARGCHRGLGIETSETCGGADVCLRCASRERCCGTPCARDQLRCLDGSPTTCDLDMLVIHTPCARFGMTCANHPTAVPDCVGPGLRCAPNLNTRCDANALVYCASGRGLNVPCDEMTGRVCASWRSRDGVSAARCIAESRQCHWNEESCDGDRVRLCDDGVRVEVDCRSLGFERCVSLRGRASCAR